LGSSGDQQEKSRQSFRAELFPCHSRSIEDVMAYLNVPPEKYHEKKTGKHRRGGGLYDMADIHHHNFRQSGRFFLCKDRSCNVPAVF
jgi:hypothetical protein